MATLFGMFPFLKTLFADSGYQGPKFAKALAKVLPHLDIEIVKRSDQVSGFVVLPKRWIVERTIAWLNRCRRLAKDWEKIDEGGFETPYRLRKQVVEPVFGQIKQARGFRQFLLRGVEKVRAEWAMICTAHNLLKLFTLANAA